jgi:hypothetical protein
LKKKKAGVGIALDKCSRGWTRGYWGGSIELRRKEMVARGWHE